MRYSKDFIDLLSMKSEDCLVGCGNPNSNILIIACEPSIPKDDVNQIEREIKKNKILWQRIIKEHVQMDEWLHTFDPNKNPCEDLVDIPNYNPFHPYYGQKNIPSPKNGGTSRSWYYYQKIIEGILEHRKSPTIDFFQNCFVTDLSAENAPNQEQTDKTNTKKSIEKRTNELFSHPFFQNFQIVIMCCGHYVKDYGIRPDELFNIPFIHDGRETNKNKEWINYHCVHGNHPRLLLHTKHLTARGLKVNDYIETIVKLCLEFVEKNNVKL